MGKSDYIGQKFGQLIIIDKTNECKNGRRLFKCLCDCGNIHYINIYSLQHGTTKSCRDASLDRIDSSKGYIEGNVRWVHKDINKMKWDMSDNEFIKWCNVIKEYNHG